jgi:outer membrane protein assembly factor BamD
MKNFLVMTFTALFLWGCSSARDTTNMSPDERLAYALTLYEDEDYTVAAEEFQAMILQFPGSAVVDNAQYFLGMTRFKRGEFIVAAFEFSRLIKNMPASEFVPEAQFMLAESYYQLSPNFTLDQRYTKKAVEEFQAFIDFFPTDAKVAEAEGKINELNNKLAHKEYNNAVIYEKLEYYNAAILYYDNVVELYHDTGYAPSALYNKIKILISRERNSEALSEIEKFLERYPENGSAAELRSLQSSLENKLSASR